MKVYILEYTRPYDPGIILGVYSTLEAAKSAAAEHRDFDFHHYEWFGEIRDRYNEGREPELLKWTNEGWTDFQAFIDDESYAIHEFEIDASVKQVCT